MNVLLITLGVAALIFGAYKLNQKLHEIYSHPFTTQLKFLQLYMLDNTDLEFYDKEYDEAMKHGQDLMWKYANEFRDKMQITVKEQQPLESTDMELLKSVIKIVKAAEAMVFIEKHGPIITQELTHHSGDETEQTERKETQS